LKAISQHKPFCTVVGHAGLLALGLGKADQSNLGDFDREI